MVFENNYSVKIVTNADYDKIKRGNYNYVALPNNTEYKIMLINNSPIFAIADVKLEGVNIGKWYIPRHDKIIIERPSNISRKFIFFDEDDNRAQDSGVVSGDEDNGLIEVTFYPEKNIMRTALLRSASAKFTSGSTVLGDYSSQKYYDKNIKNDQIDWDDPTYIVIRLIAIKKKRPYVAISKIIPPRIN